ncbi:hypothetical protein CLV91_3379 [Maribacter vaceletii]|uniref:Secreted protein (Por secretion system target) n=1 Tax=Maribacter vaceletii TaxID=1206816 RepID=A0A495DS07_9FLAO|nr:hypothetical protein [Maribacter vaceletii]RKR06524.1 hypothetical protein CLV91_3379 [Maribacter vaceletii]
MKAFLKITTVVAFMFIAAISMAKEPKLILTAYSEAKTLVLELENASNNTYIKLKDNQGNVIYTESVSNDLYSKKFNLKNLEDGVYFFETEGDFKSTSYSIKVEDNKLVILDKKEVLKPFFKETKENVSINLLNLDKEDVMIKIYDEENRLVFEEDIKDEMVVEKSFDFSGAYEGNYTVSVTYGEKSYEKYFIVN